MPEKIQTTSEKLTPKQIENWRGILSVRFGPYALIMPAHEIQAYKDKTQEEINTKAEGLENIKEIRHEA